MKQLAKIELHCHLDGSLRPETVLSLAEINHIETGTSDIDALKSMLIAPSDCDSLVTYLKRFDLPIAVLQTKEALKRAAFELMADGAMENVKYLEIRFAPQQHLAMGLSLDEVIQSTIEGIRQGEAAYEIRGNLILSYLRHTPAKGMVDMIDAGKKYLGQGVVAVDLCGPELENFAVKFVEPVRYAKSLGYEVTIHAGETGISDNVVDAIELLKADRIGHGVAMMGDPKAFAMVLDKKITIEACPTSNLQTKAVAEISQHPVDTFYRKGVLTTLNTDNRTVSNTTMSQEYELIAEAFDWDMDHFSQIYKASVEASYADDATKAWLLKFL